MKYPNTISLQGSVEHMRRRIASEQAAMHQVQLNVARWRGGITGNNTGQESAPAMATSQCEWHAAAQCHFLCWLADGGFAQACAEPLADLSAGPATSSAATPPLPAEAAKLAPPPAACHNCTA